MVEEGKISTGSELFDRFLGGGYEKGVLTTLYGPGGSGKTNLCLLALIRMTGTGKKVIYIDTESSFSVERLRQITRYADQVLARTVFFRPPSFEEQHEVIRQLPKLVRRGVGIVVVDTIAMLYRLALGEARSVQPVNTMLAKQLAILIRLARVNDLPVLVANQVYADFQDKEKMKIVGGDILRNGSRCLIELQAFAAGRRRAMLRKHRSLKEGAVDFVITQKGIASPER